MSGDPSAGDASQKMGELAKASGSSTSPTAEVDAVGLNRDEGVSAKKARPADGPVDGMPDLRIVEAAAWGGQEIEAAPEVLAEEEREKQTGTAVLTAAADPEAGSPAVPYLVLRPEAVSRELVALRAGNGQVLAAYQEVAGGVLRKNWRRSSLFFSSVREGDGATEAAVNLAALISRQGSPVLLVELMLSEPVLWTMLGKPPLQCGFEGALRDNSDYADCVQPVAGECLNVLMVREAMAAEEAAQLSGALNDFLEWAEERFAWLIYLCPPVLTPGWTRWLDLNADPVILVTRRNQTRRHELRKVVRHLGDRLAGTLLNSASR